MRLLLSVLPSFQNKSFLVAHLGNACISAYLKKNLSDLVVNTLDLRVAQGVREIWGADDLPQITTKNTFVSDIYDLPLIASLIHNYQKNKSLKEVLEPNLAVITRWAFERSTFYETVIDKLKKTNTFALKNLSKFAGYDIVGFSLYTTNLYFSVLMAILIKINYPKTKIVFGGPQITQGETTRELLLKGGIADYLILGEGEQPMLELINSLKENSNPDKIIGLKTISNFNEPDTFSQSMNLEELPVPDYSTTNFQLFNPKVIPIYSNRGCPFRCHFCSEHSLFGKKFKRRSPQRVVEDMKYLSNKHNIYEFTIADSLINSSDEWLEEFVEVLANTEEKFLWGGYFRAEMEEQLISKMKKVGLNSAILGVESFSQETLDNMNKKKVKQETIDTINYLVDNEVYAFVNLFVAYPGEKEDAFITTLEVSNRLYKEIKARNKAPFFRLTARNFQLRPFSNVYKAYEKFGLEAKTWSDSYDEVHFGKELKNVFDKTLCTFSVTDVSLNETLHRTVLMKQIREKTI
jgi:radical SAM superfamily enzyme YgiQ (UPF0313 family)